MKTKVRITTVRVVLALLFATLMPVQKAQALFGLGDIVYDPANHAENVLQATRALLLINNQIKQLARQAEMLAHQSRNLAGLPTSAAVDLRTSLSRIDGLIRNAEGIAYNVSAIDGEYHRIFPENYAPNTSTSKVLADARAAWTLARAGYRHALDVQAEVMREVRGDASLLDMLTTKSQGAVGNLQALQAGNQLTALATKQSMQMQSLMAASARAHALDRARAIATHEQGRARFERFIGDSAAYTRN